MISSVSRYRDSKIVVLPYGDGQRRTIVPSAQGDYTFRFQLHTVRAGERVDTLAARYYGDEDLWWQIADGNPERLDWMTLTPGEILRIPHV